MPEWNTSDIHPFPGSLQEAQYGTVRNAEKSRVPII